jgi:hypothetical protein
MYHELNKYKLKCKHREEMEMPEEEGAGGNCSKVLI